MATIPTQIQIFQADKTASNATTTSTTAGFNTNVQPQVQILKSRPFNINIPQGKKQCRSEMEKKIS